MPEPAAETPGDPSAMDRVLALVKQLADRSQYKEALRCLDRQETHTVELRLWQGILLLNLDDLQEALSRFRQCVFLRPDDPDLRRWLAVAYESLGMNREAEREHRNAEGLSL